MTGDQFNQFHRDLSNMVKAGVSLPIADNDQRLSVPQALRQLDANRRQIEGKLGQLVDLQPMQGVPQRYLAALQVYALTGNLYIVLDGLTRRTLAISQVKRCLRWPLLYLSLVVILALVGFYFFQQYFLPIVNGFREETRLPEDSAMGPMGYFGLSVVAGWFMFAPLIALLLAVIFNFFNRLVMWLGGRQYIQFSTAAETGRAISALLSRGVGHDIAIELASRLTGLGERSKDILFSKLTTLNQDRDWLGWTQLWSNEAQRQFNRVRFVIPSLMIVLIGGIVLLGYALMVYGTILLIYDDLLGELQ